MQTDAIFSRRHFLLIILCLAPLPFAGCASGPTKAKITAAPLPARAPVIFMAGDSTMSLKPLFPGQPERGWGQLLPLYFKEDVRIQNLAKNGRSTKSFRDEGRWQSLVDQIKPGDFVIIQFGHNDEKQADPQRYSAAFGAFQKNLEQFIEEVRAKKGQPILATPIVRRSFAASGELNDTHGDYSIAVRKVAAGQNVPLLDLDKRSATLIRGLGAEPSKKLYLWCEPGEFASLPNGKKDDTHLNAFGASRICDLVVEEIRTVAPDLAQWLVPGK